MTSKSLPQLSIQEQFQLTRQHLVNHINDNYQTIILYGSGGNGKSHLTQELNEILNQHEYVIYSPSKTYEWNKQQFIVNLNNREKKIIHLLFNPFDYWNINNDTNVQLIDMNNMKW
jgi:chromosomal replication initiation ATPase DnaA